MNIVCPECQNAMSPHKLKNICVCVGEFVCTICNTQIHIDTVGNKRFYKNLNLHRNNGPAIEYKDGTKKWFQYGLKHREDGPAVTYKRIINDYFMSDEWWYKGKKILCQSQEEFERLIKLRMFW